MPVPLSVSEEPAVYVGVPAKAVAVAISTDAWAFCVPGAPVVPVAPVAPVIPCGPVGPVAPV